MNSVDEEELMNSVQRIIGTRSRLTVQTKMKTENRKMMYIFHATLRYLLIATKVINANYEVI